jgi:DMSO reductase family type II enzyme chaperone
MERTTIEAKRQTELTAVSRANVYSLFSQLLSSPHELKPISLTPDFSLEGLPIDFDVSNMIDEYLNLDHEELRLRYSGLFEVGDDGPPAPIREDLFLAQPAKLREDLVRFYDYFGYELNEEFQWQMDHLSIELEFMHFLIVGELRSDADKLSFQLGQFDFIEKHLINWVPVLSKKLSDLDHSDIYTKIVIELDQFLLSDHNWQKETISKIDVAGG